MSSILCLNAGSSSLKAAVYRVLAEAGDDDDGGPLALERRVLVEGIGGDGGHLTVSDAEGARLVDQALGAEDHGDALDAVLDTTTGSGAPAAVVHRIVHGGPDIVTHVRIDDRVRAALEGAIVFAPLHLPAELSAVDAITARYPAVVQIACLDTAFHRTMPTVAHRYALPDAIVATGVRRYGFHGLSYEYVVRAVGAGRLGRAVLAHLGNGASLCAVEHGRSVDTTMGLTPIGGLVMGTRPGDLDPGVVVHLARTMGLDANGLEDLLDHRSGLLGLSGGRTNDVRTLVADRAAGDAGAALALAVFVRTAAKGIGALTTVLGGLDTIVFTGGIGEHAVPVRAEVAAALGHLGVVVDPSRNRSVAGGVAVTDVSAVDASVATLVVPTNEEQVMARHALRWVRPRDGRKSVGPEPAENHTP